MPKQLSKNKRLEIEKKKTAELLKRVGYVKPRPGRKIESNLPGKVNSTYYDKRDIREFCVGDQTTGNKNDIITNMYKFDKATQNSIKEKASRVAPAYSKGGLQYLGDGKEAWLHAGKKNST